MLGETSTSHSVIPELKNTGTIPSLASFESLGSKDCRFGQYPYVTESLAGACVPITALAAHLILTRLRDPLDTFYQQKGFRLLCHIVGEKRETFRQFAQDLAAVVNPHSGSTPRRIRSLEDIDFVSQGLAAEIAFFVLAREAGLQIRITSLLEDIQKVDMEIYSPHQGDSPPLYLDITSSPNEEEISLKLQEGAAVPFVVPLRTGNYIRNRQISRLVQRTLNGYLVPNVAVDDILTGTVKPGWWQANRSAAQSVLIELIKMNQEIIESQVRDGLLLGEEHIHQAMGTYRKLMAYVKGDHRYRVR